ncbi:MAG TPA: ATP-binding protein [Gemmatimonadaceae bacterium]|nr:ATP-binding protein [Gemmatimonadaceae bacterium]
MPVELFESHLRYPLEDARCVYESLVGLDEVKTRLIKEAIVLTRPERLQQWSTKYHGSIGVKALAAIRYGTPLIIFAGDVGTGKSALAESFGDAVARALGQPASLLRMSIQTRGSGIVGDMTRQISRAFRAVETEARRTRHVTILLLDEADALAESREAQQMHHEDRAGVNALIQGVDHLRSSGIPALVVFCSNRLESIDPAVLRRAVDVVVFRRPDAAQRLAHLARLLGDLPLTEPELQRLVELTGPREEREYGYTYSDISDRLVRKAILEAFPDAPLSFELLERVAQATTPTRPFQGTST